MAPDAPETVAPLAAGSPWWYRMRLVIIGAVYFCGFFFGNLISAIAGLPAQPAAEQWGASLNPSDASAPFGLAFGLAVIAWALRVWGGAYLHPDVVWNPQALDDRLLVDGPFRYVRNPLYLGNILLAIGVGLMAPPIGFVVIVAGNVLVVRALIRFETHLLRARFGALFDAYAASVPALFPRLQHRYIEGTAQVSPSLVLGLRSEIFSGLIALVLLAIWVREVL